MRAFVTGIVPRKVPAALLAALVVACGFDPVTRRLKPERLSHERVELLGALDARGEYALIAQRSQSAGLPQLSITRWRADQRCDVPLSGKPVAGPLARALRGDAKQPALYLPLSVAQGDTHELFLVDETCATHGPFGTLDEGSARTVTSARDQHGYLLFRDPEDMLWVLDPQLELAALPVASGVEAVRATLEAGGSQRDALWLAEQGALVLRTLRGEQLARAGNDVHALVLSSGHTRVAFVDGADLYEVVAPKFVPRLIAVDACAPHYDSDSLELFSPCADEALVRVALSNGRHEEFEPGVFASNAQEGVQLDYSKQPDGPTQLTASYADGERVPVEPALALGHTYVLADQRIAGLDEDGRFGVWNRDGQRFSTLLEGVVEVEPHHRGKTHTYSWLLYHDVVDGLGSLTLLDADGMRLSLVAEAVPTPARQGYLIAGGESFVRYPFSAPLVVLLEGAHPSAELPDSMCGRLRALSVTGEPRADLADDVCSYALVAAPVPGVLYAVDSGPLQGLWFVAL